MHVWLFWDQKKLNDYQRTFIENTRFCSLQDSGSFAAFAFIQCIHSRNDLKNFEGFLPLWLSSEIIDCGQQRLDLTGSNVQWLMVRWDNCSTKWEETLRISWTITTHSYTAPLSPNYTFYADWIKTTWRHSAWIECRL